MEGYFLILNYTKNNPLYKRISNTCTFDINDAFRNNSFNQRKLIQTRPIYKGVQNVIYHNLKHIVENQIDETVRFNKPTKQCVLKELLS